MHEFEIIEKFFIQRITQQRTDVVLGSGDDCALLEVPQGHILVASTDTLVTGVHFFENAKPYDVGYKAIAVNLSDLAAMGAEPAWVTGALTLPRPDEQWLQAFSDGFFSLLKRFSVQLVGGDLTRGPLAITVQALGFLPKGQALCRRGAQPGDAIYVTGQLGDAGLGLRLLRGEVHLPIADQNHVLQRLHRPEPRVAAGLALRNIASSAIDISDGLLADLGHILQQSNVGATLFVDRLPLSSTLATHLPKQNALALALTAGDDYELCFTVPAKRIDELDKARVLMGCDICSIGVITQQGGVQLIDEKGQLVTMNKQGFEHF